MTQPGKGPLDDPPLGEEFEALSAWLALDDFDLDREIRRQLPQPLARVAAIRSEPLQAGKALGQQRQQPTGDFCCPILVMGLAHEGFQHQP